MHKMYTNYAYSAHCSDCSLYGISWANLFKQQIASLLIILFIFIFQYNLSLLLEDNYCLGGGGYQKLIQVFKRVDLLALTRG